MMIALASMHDLPTIIVPGGATLPPTHGEDAGKVQTIGARFANHDLTLEEAAMLGCRACASPGGGCQFLGTAGTSQVVAEGLGLALPHSALAPSGQEVWLEIARQSARAALTLERKGLTTRDILTDKAIENAMTVHAALAVQPICCCIFRPLPMPRDAASPTSNSGPPSIAGFRVWSACCLTVRFITRRYARFWRAACPK